MAVSTCNPPHEQLLVGLGAGASLSSLCVIVVLLLSSLSLLSLLLLLYHRCLRCCCVIIRCRRCHLVIIVFVVIVIIVSSPLSPLYSPWCTHHPPNEQLLVSMGVGAPSNVVHHRPVPPPPPPPPPPRPPLSVVGRHCRSSSIPCRPTFMTHPTGNGSLGRGQVVRFVVVVVVVVPPSLGVRRLPVPLPIVHVVCHCLSSVLFHRLSLFVVPHCSLSPCLLFVVPHHSLSHHCSLSVIVPIPLFVVHPLLSPVVPPMSHPTSSCS
jgi:hypothetical protein